MCTSLFGKMLMRILIINDLYSKFVSAYVVCAHVCECVGGRR